jgi:lipid II:glycine glycyltransferase (peptidoglycan interpeptide bridge formation enzyme)
MEIIDKNTFFELTRNFEIVPVTQSRGWYQMLSQSGEERIKFFVDNAQNPAIVCFAHEKRFFNAKMLLIEGECFAKKNNTENRKQAQQFIKNLQQFYSDFTKLGYDIVEIQSNSQYNFAYETALRQAGFLRPVGQFSIPITRLIDLTKKIEYDRNWSRNIKKSESFNLSFEYVASPSIADCADFCSIYNAMNERKGMGGKMSRKFIFGLCNDVNIMLFFVKKDNKRIATIIIYKKNETAEGIFAGSTKEALEVSATFFMYNEMFKTIENQGVAIYDMAKLLPSNKDYGKVFQFKNGIAGNTLVLNGEFSWYKRQIYRPMMYFVKKYLIKKREM